MLGWLSDAAVLASRRKRSTPSPQAQHRRHHLDRHLAIERDVVREIDRGHSAAAELARDVVVAECGGAQQFQLELRGVGRGSCRPGCGWARGIGRRRRRRVLRRGGGRVHARELGCATGGAGGVRLARCAAAGASRGRHGGRSKREGGRPPQARSKARPTPARQFRRAPIQHRAVGRTASAPSWCAEPARSARRCPTRPTANRTGTSGRPNPNIQSTVR